MNRKVRIRCSCGGSLIASSCPPDVAEKIAGSFRDMHFNQLAHREVDEAEYQRILDRQRYEEKKKEKASRR